MTTCANNICIEYIAWWLTSIRLDAAILLKWNLHKTSIFYNATKYKAKMFESKKARDYWRIVYSVEVKRKIIFSQIFDRSADVPQSIESDHIWTSQISIDVWINQPPIPCHHMFDMPVLCMHHIHINIMYNICIWPETTPNQLEQT